MLVARWNGEIRSRGGDRSGRVVAAVAPCTRTTRVLYMEGGGWLGWTSAWLGHGMAGPCEPEGPRKCRQPRREKRDTSGMSLPPSSFSHRLPRPYLAWKGHEVVAGGGSVELRCLPLPPKARSNEPQAEVGEERDDSSTLTRRKGADGGGRGCGTAGGEGMGNGAVLGGGEGERRRRWGEE
uniref:Uncharacterized protein n=1 Tax=Oryza punctata TaxID=4537 RepID=A0A0E0JIU5_ORYPU